MVYFTYLFDSDIFINVGHIRCSAEFNDELVSSKSLTHKRFLLWKFKFSIFFVLKSSSRFICITELLICFKLNILKKNVWIKLIEIQFKIKYVNNYPKGTTFKEIIKTTDNIAVAFFALLIIGLSFIEDNLSKILSLSFNAEFS